MRESKVLWGGGGGACKCRRLTVKEIWLLSIFDMMLKAILCVQHFFSFGPMLFIVNLLIKTDSTVICVAMSRFL